MELCPIFYVFSRFGYSSIQEMFLKLTGFELCENRHIESRILLRGSKCIGIRITHIISDLVEFLYKKVRT
jgi:hypothetical protein